MYRGKLKKWNDEKGYGFITTPELKTDTFIHVSTLKHMSRKPKEGDYIHFDIEQSNGKSNATNARIEGVIANKPRKIQKNNSRLFSKAISATFIITLVLFVFNRYKQDPYLKPINESEITPTDIKTIQPTIIKQSSHQFTCDGRQYCTDMTSREEAEFFIRHCPNTKMDGDNDGIPCERDTRF